MNEETKVENAALRVEADAQLPVSPCRQELQCLTVAVQDLAGKLDRLSGQQQFIQDSIPSLQRAARDCATSLGAPRVRSLYERLLLLYDLVEPPGAGSSAEVRELSRLIAGQIEQFLEVEGGLTRIEAEGGLFDRACHKPVGFVDCLREDEHNRVKEVVRHGFRSEHSVLRPAEVRLAKYKAPRPAEAGGGRSEEEQ